MPRLYYFVPVERRALRENSKLFFQSVSSARNDLDQLLSTECFWHVPGGYSAMEALAEGGCGQCCDIAIPAQRNITFTKKTSCKSNTTIYKYEVLPPSTYFQTKFYQKGLYLKDIMSHHCYKQIDFQQILSRNSNLFSKLSNSLPISLKKVGITESWILSKCCACILGFFQRLFFTLPSKVLNDIFEIILETTLKNQYTGVIFQGGISLM